MRGGRHVLLRADALEPSNMARLVVENPPVCVVRADEAFPPRGQSPGRGSDREVAAEAAMGTGGPPHDDSGSWRSFRLERTRSASRPVSREKANDLRVKRVERENLSRSKQLLPQRVTQFPRDSHS